MKSCFKIKNASTLVASSVMEVVVALIICMILFSISTNIILKNQRSNNIVLKYKAKLILSSITRNNIDEYANYNVPGIVISVTKVRNDSLKNICSITVSVCDHEKRILCEKIFLGNVENYRDIDP